LEATRPELAAASMNGAKKRGRNERPLFDLPGRSYRFFAFFVAFLAAFFAAFFAIC
jgi:hypothetical protein